MTDTKELLSAASVCRVYASAGMAVVWGPDQLRRHADLLDKQRAECEQMLQDALRSREKTMQSLAQAKSLQAFTRKRFQHARLLFALTCAMCAGTLIVVLT